jgi:Ca2+-binding RTX toxin-like protein
MTDATTFSKLVITGDKALIVSALSASVNSIDASGMTTGGSFVQDARSGTSAASYVGSAGSDTFIMKNAADAIDGGSGTDTLEVSGILILGGLQVDLSSTSDQITSYNGNANSAIQFGFENVDVSGVTGTFGADITANKAGSLITGTLNRDQITLGAGADTLVFNSATSSDVVTGYSVTNDSISLSKTAYSALGVPGALSSGEFLSGAGITAAAAPGERVIYNTTTGDLYYDADGNVAGSAAVLIGTFTGAPTLVVAEFTIVA